MNCHSWDRSSARQSVLRTCTTVVASQVWIWLGYELKYLEVFELAGSEHDLIIRDVYEKMTVTRTDAAVAAHDFGVGVVEGRRCDGVCECAAMA